MEGFLKKNYGLLFIIPWWLGFTIFKLYLFISSMIYSSYDYNLFHIPTFTALGNYIKVLKDPLMIKVFSITLEYAFITAPLELIPVLFIAYISNLKVRGVKFFRVACYIPSILGGSVSIAVLRRFLFKTEGLVNMALAWFSIEPYNWLGKPDGAFLVIVLLEVWQFGSPMIIFLAALGGVSTDLYEAASINGVGRWRESFSIITPLITSAILYNFVAQLCHKFQEFNSPYIITQGGPFRSTILVSLLVYNNAFKSYEMDMASAIVQLLFFVIMALTAVTFVSRKYWVYYSDEDGR